jgi:hypothetical protein
MREGEDVLDHDHVYFLVVEYGMITPVLLFDVEDGG